MLEIKIFLFLDYNFNFFFLIQLQCVLCADAFIILLGDYLIKECVSKFESMYSTKILSKEKLQFWPLTAIDCKYLKDIQIQCNLPLGLQ